MSRFAGIRSAGGRDSATISFASLIDNNNYRKLLIGLTLRAASFGTRRIKNRETSATEQMPRGAGRGGSGGEMERH